MRRFVCHSLVALLVLTGSAVVGGGPRAAAGYLSRADEPGSSAAPVEAATDSAPALPAKVAPDPDRKLPSEGILAGGHGMSSGPSASAGFGTAPVADTGGRSGLPADLLVWYFREPPSSLELTSFPESLLDPPRLV